MDSEASVTTEEVEAFVDQLTAWMSQLPAKERAIATVLVQSALEDDVQGFDNAGNAGNAGGAGNAGNAGNAGRAASSLYLDRFSLLNMTASALSAKMPGWRTA